MYDQLNAHVCVVGNIYYVDAVIDISKQLSFTLTVLKTSLAISLPYHISHMIMARLYMSAAESYIKP